MIAITEIKKKPGQSLKKKIKINKNLDYQKLIIKQKYTLRRISNTQNKNQNPATKKIIIIKRIKNIKN